MSEPPPFPRAHPNGDSWSLVNGRMQPLRSGVLSQAISPAKAQELVKSRLMLSRVEDAPHDSYVASQYCALRLAPVYYPLFLLFCDDCSTGMGAGTPSPKGHMAPPHARSGMEDAQTEVTAAIARFSPQMFCGRDSSYDAASARSSAKEDPKVAA